MTNRPAFYPAHNCVCAYADTPILDFYREYYDAVYIILHPFIRKGTNGDVSIVSWHEMLELTEFRTINQLDIALRNWIGGLAPKWRSDRDLNVLKTTCEAHGLTQPTEGRFQDILVNDMLNALQEQGHQFIFVGDEFGSERKVQFIQEMIDNPDKNKFCIGGHDCWYTSKNEILYAVHWDSHFTMLCSNNSKIEDILARHPFEGFYCNDQTEIYWSLKQDAEL